MENDGQLRGYSQDPKAMSHGELFPNWNSTEY
jgi:hypothetical protein